MAPIKLHEDGGLTRMGLETKNSRSDVTTYLSSSGKHNDLAGSAFLSYEEPQVQEREVQLWGKVFLTCRRLMPVITCILIIALSITLGLLLWQVTISRKGSETTTPQEQRGNTDFCLQYPRLIDYKTLGPHIDSKLSSLSEVVDRISKQNDYKAISIGLIYDDQIIWRKHLGHLRYSDIKSPRVNNETPYPVASITKVITALMFAKMVSEGKISSDTFISSLDPVFKNSNIEQSNITLRQLACMTSGLRREASCNPANKLNVCPLNHTEMVKRTAFQSMIMKPNRYISYSNLGYGLLGQLLAQNVANKSYKSYVSHDIFKPLRMINSSFANKRSKMKVPQSVNPDGTRTIIPKWGWLAPAGGALMSLKDTFQILKLLLGFSAPKVVTRNAVRKLFQSERFNPDGVGYGCPFHSRMTPLPGEKFGYRVYYKDGVIFGYGSIIGFVPKLGLGISVLTAGKLSNAYPIYSQIFPAAMEILDKSLRRLDSERYKLPDDPTKYTGKYKLDTYWPLINSHIEISLENGILYLQMDWFKGPLSYIGQRTLETVDYAKLKVHCSMRNIGIINEKYFFDESLSKTEKYRGFSVHGISVSGYSHFSRITDG